MTGGIKKKMVSILYGKEGGRMMLRYIEKPEGGYRVETNFGLDLKGAALPENESVIVANSGKDFVLIFNNGDEACLVQMNRGQMAQLNWVMGIRLSGK